MRTRNAGIRATRAIDVVEAAYRVEGTEAEWAERVLDAARPDLDTGCGTYAFTGYDEVPNLAASPVFVQRDLDHAFGARVAELNRDVPSEMLELLRTRFVTCGGLEQSLGAKSPIMKHFRSVVKPIGIVDGFSMFARDAAGGSVTISAPSRKVVELAPRVRAIWRRVGLHVASGLRLRRRLAAQATVRDALLDPSGKVHDAGRAIKDDETARSVLVRAVRAMEQARSANVRTSPDGALMLWQGLVAGTWSLIEHWESDGKRYLAAYRNRPHLRDPRALTATERSILTYLSLGATNKDVVYALGLPAGTVSASVVQIFKKLGVKHRVELAVLADPSRMARFDVSIDDGDIGVLSVDGRPRGGLVDALSAAELEVASLAVRAWSNEKIARERHVSVSTIANQLRAIYEKLGVTSRSQLARAITK
jgi:DNA-binding NarL/FixJ family response regulator